MQTIAEDWPALTATTRKTHNKDNSKIQSNLVMNIVPVTYDDKGQQGIVYDLQGRAAQQLQKGNVYIKNGKKFMAK